MKIDIGLEVSPLPVVSSRQMQDLIRQVADEVLGVNKSKGGEYSGDTNALANFERLAVELNMSPEKVLWVYMTKHLDSIRTYIKNISTQIDEADRLNGPLPVLSEPITGRVMDVIAYMCLFTAQCERRNKQHAFNQCSTNLASKEAEVGDTVNEPAAVEEQINLSAHKHAQTPATLAETSFDSSPMDHEAFTPIEKAGPQVPDLSEMRRPEPRTTLTVETAQYGQFFRILRDAKGSVVSTRHPDYPNNVASWERYRILARDTQSRLLCVSESGVQTMINPTILDLTLYTTVGQWPQLPVLGETYKRGTLAGVHVGPIGDKLITDWNASATLRSEDAYGLLLVDMDILASEVNGGQL